jgi:Zn-dependent protease/predicted RNA-binding Zn-ribbon protein involved in translation (DUF1610 family)
MQKTSISGGIRLFEIAGITVFLHWSWFVIALYDLRTGFSIGHGYQHQPAVWQVAEYLSVFIIVLMHEFGHALACRSVGGEANRILLWPLGGVAYVSPPARPGAVLWSIAAGPLVNVALLPLLFGASVLFRAAQGIPHDLIVFIGAVTRLNIVLLVFNLLPIYPLDGGKILQSLLWFPIGRIWSLRVATVVGLLGTVAVALLGFTSGSTWLIVLALYGGWQCVNGFRTAAALNAWANLPRRAEFKCPNCGKPPVIMAGWKCGCGAMFDTFATGFQCPQCGSLFSSTTCPECRTSSDPRTWAAAAAPPAGSSLPPAARV